MCDLKLKKIARRILTRTKYLAKRTGGPTLETPECKKAEKPGFDTKIDFRGLAKFAYSKFLVRLLVQIKRGFSSVLKSIAKRRKN